ncbi:MAG: hypothetical protein JWQ39_1445, partial [Glaciihabitans sp.]|nr:hypothetical protein [Glaciihabitans sp.]
AMVPAGYRLVGLVVMGTSVGVVVPRVRV